MIERFLPPAGHLAAFCAGMEAGANAGARIAPIATEFAATIGRDAK